MALYFNDMNEWNILFIITTHVSSIHNLIFFRVGSASFDWDRFELIVYPFTFNFIDSNKFTWEISALLRASLIIPSSIPCW